MANDIAGNAPQIIADLRRELAFRTAERDEALAQQTATAEVLQVINASPGDLNPVFHAMLGKALRLCGAAHGDLLSYDGERFHVAAMVHEDSRMEELDRLRPPFEPPPDGPLDLIIRGEEVVYVDLQDHAYPLTPELQALMESGGYRGLLNVALRKEGTLLGVISIFTRAARLFTDKEIALLQNFAAQAVIAMENARLITETREALEQQTATAEVLGVINSSPGDLAPVFEAMLEKAMRLCEADFGALCLFAGEGFRVTATRGLPTALDDILQGELPVHPASVPDRLRRGEGVIHIPDLTAVEGAARTPVFDAMIDLGGARSTVWVDLRKDDRAVGYFAIYRQEVRPFTDTQIALLQNFAAQAVIAMENARLITETREALEQQTATAEVLGVINSSPGDLAPVFDAMLDKALHLCGAAFGILHTYDGDHIHTVAHRGLSPSYVEFLSAATHQPGTSGPISAFLRGEPFVHWDAAESQAYREGHPLARALVDLEGGRTLLAVPLRKDAALLGMFVIYRREVRPFSEKPIALLQSFAAQAVIAMENARLITETREALEQQTATAEVLGVINASPGDLAPVFDAMLEKATRLCAAAFGTLYTYDGEGFRAATLHGVPQPYAESLSQEPIQFARGTKTALGQIAEGSDFAHFDDVAAEEGYMISARRLIELAGARTVMVVALRKDGKLLGAISAFRQEVRPFTDKQIALLQNFAAQAVIAMENARLITETREALAQQTATAEVLGVINSSPGDLAPVFDAMLEKALHLCDAAFGFLWEREGDAFHMLAQRDVPAALLEITQRPVRNPPPGGALGRIIDGEALVHIPDLTAAAPVPNAIGLRTALVELGGARTQLLIPLRKEGELVGVFHAYRREVRPFTDKQIALLQNFAAQAVIAMENARLLGELRQRTEEVAGWNRELEDRVAAQLAEIERTGKLRRFLAPQLAEMILARGDESILESHRREIVVVFCDVRGFTGFAERAEPEEVMAFLRDYHAALGPIVARFEGTLDHYSGDGIMVFFNDPLPTPEPAKRAIEMAVAMRETAQEVLRIWRRHGHDIGFGVGISQGYATLGQIGFAERMDYTAIGTVTNLAARLCAEAKDGQILISRRVAVAVEDAAKLEEIGDVSLKGLSQAVAVFNVV
jgi:GAF domain-containing protein